MIQERRQYQRLVPDSRAPIYLDEAASVLLFDVSEGGVGVTCATPTRENQTISLAFDLPGMGDPIRARAETAWISGLAVTATADSTGDSTADSIGVSSNDSRVRAGFRFLDLPEASRQQLREWIASRAYDTAQPPAALPEAEPASPVAAPAWQDREFAGWRAALASASQARPGRLWRTVALGVAIIVLVPTCLFLGHLLGDMGQNGRIAEINAVAKADAPAPAAGVSALKPPVAKPSAAANLDFPALLSLDRPGFVVQTGAMTHENYADDMRASLAKHDFPAFVFRRGTGPFYRVAVGPYSDAQSAAKMQAELKRLGFDTLVKRWSPE
jgi:SPOR domain/PilZ domain